MVIFSSSPRWVMPESSLSSDVFHPSPLSWYFWSVTPGTKAFKLKKQKPESSRLPGWFCRMLKSLLICLILKSLSLSSFFPFWILLAKFPYKRTYINIYHLIQPVSYLPWSFQDLQDEVAKESEELLLLQSQRQKVQQALEELDQQKSSLEEQLTHIRQQTGQETKLVCLVEFSSLY